MAEPGSVLWAVLLVYAGFPDAIAGSADLEKIMNI
jgi:hypothetical protein